VKLEKQDQDFLNQLAAADGPPLYTLSYKAARQVLDKLQSGPVAKLPADITQRTVPGGPTGPVSIRVVRPAGVKGPLPGIVYIHGGGWVLGNAMTHDRLVRQIANGARAAVVFVNYTPSPEARFPVPIQQAYTVAQWVARHGRTIDIDPTRLAIAGDSVGGDMTAAVTLMAKQRGGPHFARQVLLYPVTDARFDTASYNRLAEGCWLTRPAMKWFWDAYAPDPAVRAQPLASPLNASVDQLRGLPEALGRPARRGQRLRRETASRRSSGHPLALRVHHPRLHDARRSGRHPGSQGGRRGDHRRPPRSPLRPTPARAGQVTPRRPPL
jgi:acetyl esterase